MKTRNAFWSGLKFLRFTTRTGAAGGQFSIAGFEPTFPGFFRLKVKARVTAGRSFNLGLRLNGAPYTGFSSHAFTSADWKEETYLFEVKKPRTDSVGLYLYTAAAYSGLAADEVRALAETMRLTDLYGNPVTAETLLPGTLVYAEALLPEAVR